MWTNLALLALVSCVVIVEWLRRRRRYFAQLFADGLPGPVPHLLFGNLLQYRYGRRPSHLVLDRWLAQYGRVFGFHVGLHRYVVCSDAHALRDVFVRRTETFWARAPPSIVVEQFSDSLLQIQCRSRWKQQRSLLLSALTPAKMRRMWPLLNRCVSSCEHQVAAIVVEGGRQASKQPTSDVRVVEVDVHSVFQALTCDIIACCALALDTNCQHDACDPFLQRVRQFMHNASGCVAEAAFAFPLLAQVIRAVMSVFGLTDRLVRMIVDNLTTVIQMRRSNAASCRHHDILQTILDASDGSTEQTEGAGTRHRAMSDAEIKSNALVLLLAGYETTASCLTFTAYLLATHADVQQKLYEEIMEKIGPDHEPSHDQISSLLYLDHVVCESLRLFPPVVTFVTRHCAEPCLVAGFQLPANVNILAPVWSIHHDPKLWPQPDLFQPERFASAVAASGSGEATESDQLAWMPFGMGPRACIGRRFGMLETKLTLVRLVRRFRLSKVAATECPLSVVVPTVTLCPAEAVVLGVSERSQPSA